MLSVASKPTYFLSHSHVVTGKVENILRYSVMLGYIVWSISFKVAADAVVGRVLGSSRDSTCSLLLFKMYTYLFFYIMKLLTDFRKTVETGMNPRLPWD